MKIKMNSKMAETLKQKGITMPLDLAQATAHAESPILMAVEESILLKRELDRSKSIKLSDFPDRTGFEAFINHVHFPLDDSRESLLTCLRYATDLQRELTRVGEGRRFLIVVSVQNEGCVIRFHQVRPNENWISENLEGYEDEGILLLPVESLGSSVQ